MNFDAIVSDKGEGKVRHLTLARDGIPLTQGTVLSGLQVDSDFRQFFAGLFAEVPFDAYFWETPPFTNWDLNRPFECILADAPKLAAMPANRNAFAEYFSGSEDVACFWNLVWDAYLVVPAHPYPHLAAFARTASKSVQHEFWYCVGESVMAHLSDRPLWLSTSGLGVAWLHVRLDARPKYYTHAQYRVSPRQAWT